MSQRVLKAVAGVAALAAIAFGASTIASGSNSSTGSVAASGAPPGVQGGAPPQGANGARPPGGGFGTPVTGTTAAKVKAAALAKYPGTIEQVVQVPNGGYMAHVMTSNGELHVLVDKQFNVTGVATGMPGRPGGTQPPGGTQQQPGGTT
jgi:hypothetical protein